MSHGRCGSWRITYDTNEVNAYFGAIHGVAEVHDLHIWGMSTTETALTVHLVIPGDEMRREICAELRRRFGIQHAMIQIEIGNSGYSCELTPDHLV